MSASAHSVRRAQMFFIGSLLAAMAILVVGSSASGADGEIPGRAAAKDNRLPSTSVQEEIEASRIPGHYIVVLKSSVEHPGAVAEAQTDARDGELGFVYRSALKGYSASDLSKSDVEALRADPRVKFVEPDRKVEATAQTTPTGVKRIGAATNPALDIDETDDVRVNADVAVIDTGIDYTHPDLNVVSRTSCVPANEDPGGPEWNVKACADNSGTDGFGHGTHVAGTIGALDNGIGVVGVAPGARLWAVRVLNNEGSGSTSWIIAGVDWVTAHAAQIEVANMSLGGYGRSPAEETAIKASVEAGVVYAVAAGNESANAAEFAPANDPNVITVSALADSDGKAGGKGGNCDGKDDSLAWFSNWGSDVEIAAPGTCVYSTLPVGGSYFGSSYGELSGTSMATPHVAGAAAVLAAKSNPNSKKDVEAIRQALIDEGSLDWEDPAEDARFEPLLYLGAEALKTAEFGTSGWSSEEAGKAIVLGAANPRGQKVEYRFEYGLTTSYGASTPMEAKEGKYVTLSRKLEGLELGKTYHYRLSATTASGATYGKDRTLKPSLWSKQAVSGAPAPEDEILKGVSCPTDTMCMAVGYNESGSSSAPSYKLSEGKWSYVGVPAPAGNLYPWMEGISCASANACIAVGADQIGSEVVPLIESWDGSKWTPQSVPVPSSEATHRYAYLRDVSCVSATECMAGGRYRVADVDPENPGEELWQPFFAQLKGGKWTLSYPLAPGTGYLEGVSCASATFCAAVGEQEAMSWNGTSWTTAPVTTAYYDLSCTTSTFCLAVTPAWLLDIWNGSGWTESERVENGKSTSLLDVSCDSPSLCVASGVVDNSPSPAIETWDGLGMRLQETLHGEEDSAFWSVDCSPSHMCVAVGNQVGEKEKPLIASTPNRRPLAVTDTPTGVEATKATLKGIVHPNGVETGYHFEWGTTTAYGNSIPASPKALGAGSKSIEVSEALSGLTPQTTYHYRVVAESEGGTAYGGDRAFTTPPVGAPLNTAAPTVSPAQPYVEWGEEGTKGTWTGEPTSYSYAWFSCDSSCEAVGSTLSYTPKQSDAGRTLYIAVTATNSYGSNTAYSKYSLPVEKSLKWFSCAKKTSGTYEDSGCSKVGTKNVYSWERRSSVMKTVNSGNLLIQWINGSTFQVTCSGATGTGSGTNYAAYAALNSYTLSLSGCTIKKPEGNGCLIGGGGKITTKSLKGTSPQVPAALIPELKMEPTEGSTVATFTIEGCKEPAGWINGTYNLTGWFPAQVHNGESTISTSYAESNAGLKVNSYKAGIEVWSSLSTEVGEVARTVKLDTGP